MFNRFTSILVTIFAFAVLSFASLAWAVDIECPIIADTLLAGHSAENNLNFGVSESLRVKGYQGIVVFRFDMSPAQGLVIEGGTFSAFCRSISGDAQDSSSSEGISTIAHDWIEGEGEVYTPTEDASTYDYPGGDLGMEWAKQDEDGQGRNGVQINVEDVINGFGGSILNSPIDEATFEVGEWTEIPLDPELVQDLLDGEQYGIVVWQPSWAINLDLAPREESDGQHAATLIVRASGAAVESNGKLLSAWGKLKFE